MWAADLHDQEQSASDMAYRLPRRCHPHTARQWQDEEGFQQRVWGKTFKTLKVGRKYEYVWMDGWMDGQAGGAGAPMATPGYFGGLRQICKFISFFHSRHGLTSDLANHRLRLASTNSLDTNLHVSC